MKQRFFFLFCLLAVLIVVQAKAENQPRSVDADQLDISGVRLGMNTSEATEALSTKQHIDKSVIEFDKFPSSNPITPTKEPTYFTAKVGIGKITVHLTPKVPYDKQNPMRVSMVIYEMPWTPDNVKAMMSSALEKYGQPSNGTIGVVYQWCKARPHLSKCCH